MGKSIRLKYRLEIDNTRMGWLVKDNGPANDKNLWRYVYSYAKSLELGGVNEHISLSLGYVPYPNTARIIRQSDNQVMAEWRAPMFMVW